MKGLNKYIIGGVAMWGCFYSQKGNSQTVDEVVRQRTVNTITTAVPFLLIAPDTRAGGMGDVGVATSPDANSINWNAAKMAAASDEFGISLSYTPWLRKLVNDINLTYLSFYKKVGKDQAFGGSLRYFTLGTIQFTNEFGENTIQFNPNEFALDFGYSRKLGNNLYGASSVRFIHSNLTGGINVQGAETRSANAVAVDVSVYYEKPEVKIGNTEGTFALGAAITNIGNKVSYTTSSRRDFIPINLRIGPRYTFNLDEYNQLSFSFDMNKLLVPTQPIYLKDSLGRNVTDAEGNLVILSGKDPNRAVVAGMFGSFSDAPGRPITNSNGTPIYNPDGTPMIDKGSRFTEELSEITFGVGTEYVYDKQFAVRAGYFYENQFKGNRKYFTLGAGIKYQVFTLDFSYLIPGYFGNNVQRSPLENTVRFTMSVLLEKLKKTNKADVPLD